MYLGAALTGLLEPQPLLPLSLPGSHRVRGLAPPSVSIVICTGSKASGQTSQIETSKTKS